MNAKLDRAADYDRYWQRAWDAPPRTYETASAGERHRIETIAALLPSDVGEILDVGCGDGLVTNHLASLGHRITGTDIEPVGLASVAASTRLGSAEDLPAEAGEFDCLLYCDVLEHLPAGFFEAALDEAVRVAGRFIVINCPLRERLVIAQIRCDGCETAFHSSRHVRSVDPAELTEWFPAFAVREVVACGERVVPRIVWLQRLGQLVADHWYEAPAAVCPNCGYPVTGTRRTPLLRAVFAAIHRLAGLLRRPRPIEFVALLERRAQSG